ncbi:MAG: hypothetical protein K5669_12565 [Lachnospiraceae bacterium]|nr:hypothetical protein [Lachnospiraceae bacterium]
MRLNENSFLMGGNGQTVARISTGASPLNDRLSKEIGGNFDKQNNTISGAALREKFDPIAARKNSAKKQAMRIIGEAVSNDTRIDEGMEEHRKKVRELTAENYEYSKEITKIEDQRKGLRSAYGVTEDSEEEQDLQLLSKEAESRFKGSKITLTDEEIEKLKEIKKGELTEYQKHSLELKNSEKEYADKIYDNERQIGTENSIIAGTKLERLKHAPMVDAKKRANLVLEQANDETKVMLFEEGKEHLDEQFEEKIEDAKEKREEEEKLEERIEKIKDDKREKQKITEEILESTTQMEVDSANFDGAVEQVKEMMSKLKLLEEDIKGAAVDKEV